MLATLIEIVMQLKSIFAFTLLKITSFARNQPQKGYNMLVYFIYPEIL